MQIMVGTDSGLFGVGERESRELGDHAITAIAPGDGCHLCVTDRRTIWRRDDGGDAVWEEVARCDDENVSSLMVSIVGVLVGTSGGRLWRLTQWRRSSRWPEPEQGQLKGKLIPLDGFDAAVGRERWWQAPGLDVSPNVRSMTQGPDLALYANVHVGGVLRSRDFGETWEPTIDQEADVHELKALPDGTLVAATGEAGLCISSDGGDTWRSVTDGLPSDRGWRLAYTRSVAVVDRTVIITGSNGAVTEDAGVYRRRLDEVGPLIKCTAGLPETFADNINTGCLLAHDGYVAFGTTEGSVFASRDAGESWEQIAKDLPPVLCVGA